MPNVATATSAPARTTPSRAIDPAEPNSRPVSDWRLAPARAAEAIAAASIGRTACSAKSLTRRASRDSYGSIWSSGDRVIVELLPEACEQSGEAGAYTAAGHPDGSADLVGGEAGRIAQGDEGSVLGLETGERVGEVEVGGAAGWVGREAGTDACARGLLVRDHRFAEPTPIPDPDELPRLVRGDRHEPRSKAIGRSDRVELCPCLLPGGLH